MSIAQNHFIIFFFFFSGGKQIPENEVAKMVPRSLHAEVPTARDSLSVPLCRAGTPQKAPTRLVPS